MVDDEGYRLNVGIVLCNKAGQVFWARRIGMRSWQFPQGGIKAKESPEAAMFRELHEETGLAHKDVEVIGRTQDWLRYRLPERYIRRNSFPLCIGQKQVWFLLRLQTCEDRICLDRCRRPEFDAWRWVEYWQPVREVVYFKREVYRQALLELAKLLAPESVPIDPKSFLTARGRL
ncbi:MAG: RNA pyrophosphohydrolase [Methylohalobius sp.]|nr:RNA pyrophosphohydrolase [Methylohalobius sp.]